MGNAGGRILIIWDRIGDYHRARVRAVEELAGAEQVLTADFGSRDALYGWEGRQSQGRHILLSEKPVDQRDVLVRCRRFWSLLGERGVGRVAIPGYGRLEYLLFILLARIRGCRVTLFAESWYGRSRIRNWLKGTFLRLTCHCFFVSGQRAREHFHQRLGIPGKRLFSGYSVVDNPHFERAGDAVREPVILCVARFSPEKNLELLIGAFQRSRLSATHTLRLIGGGPDEETLRTRATGSARIEFAGWVPYAELPAEYTRASIFILPSRFEPWGLVVNEAMAAGLPVLVSDACGCQPDLVHSGRNGFVFPSADEDSLVALLDRTASLSPSDLNEMGRQSRLIIGGFSCPGWAASLVDSFA